MTDMWQPGRGNSYIWLSVIFITDFFHSNNRVEEEEKKTRLIHEVIYHLDLDHNLATQQ